jgi:hypothetical protein
MGEVTVLSEAVSVLQAELSTAGLHANDNKCKLLAVGGFCWTDWEHLLLSTPIASNMLVADMAGPTHTYQC